MLSLSKSDLIDYVSAVLTPSFSFEFFPSELSFLSGLSPSVTQGVYSKYASTTGLLNAYLRMSSCY